ncbi:MFS transporter [Aquipuribacter sp. SD81]|uniref:MFS transporter n=1 Tax=Aquipuribacter sp. SD81 TaxID=3127703 RepID=UPI00301869BA
MLATAQVAIGLGAGVGVAAGSLVAREVAGRTALSGLAQTASVLGAALLAVPLARLAARTDRRTALVAGLLLAVAGAAGIVAASALGSFALLLLAAGLFGGGTAVGLQARFAATDGVEAGRRGRALSTVVWATTVGAVLGPNVTGPAGRLDAVLGLPPFTGAYVVAALAFGVAAVVLLLGLPRLRAGSVPTDPSDPSAATPAATARGTRGAGAVAVGPAAPVPGTREVLRAVWQVPAARLGVVALGAAHAVMVGVMVMTPVHLEGHGARVTVIGLVISGHVAGMYALSPLFGALADRWGPRAGIACGLGLLVASLAVAALGGWRGTGPLAHGAVAVALVLLGLGWSASLVSGSAVLARAFDGADPRARALQGASDLVMGVAGAGAGAVAGPVLAVVGYPGLAAVAGVPLLGVAVLLLRRPEPVDEPARAVAA